MALDLITLGIILIVTFFVAFEISKVVYHSVADLASVITAALATYVVYTLLV
ncbi:hypothetical protein IPA_06115 [Ignicoccus pacificus DSM 13166]|uniref:Uncharacterized protein n=1 Tax=Ignicoccus pacificus DSM 13166 TaxID=940294 RepID=A0A977PK70_9CREN|nr:hypothetical protein IPA_06115 [Ignicoccus pacificus DSM 13166]